MHACMLAGGTRRCDARPYAAVRSRVTVRGRCRLGSVGKLVGEGARAHTLTWHVMLAKCTVLWHTCLEQKRATPSDT